MFLATCTYIKCYKAAIIWMLLALIFVQLYLDQYLERA